MDGGDHYPTPAFLVLAHFSFILDLVTGMTMLHKMGALFCCLIRGN